MYWAESALHQYIPVESVWPLARPKASHRDSSTRPPTSGQMRQYAFCPQPLVADAVSSWAVQLLPLAMVWLVTLTQ